MKKTKEQKRIASHKRCFAILRFLRACARLVMFEKHIGNVKKYDDGAIIVGNHYRMWDVAYPLSCTSRPMHFMAKNQLWNNKILAKLLNWIQCIPVSRDGSDARALMTAMKYLKNGENVVIFPEGMRNKTGGELLEFKGGAALMAIKMQKPIIPIVQVKPAKAFRKAVIIHGDPIVFSEFFGKKLTEEEMKYCENKLRSTMVQLRQDYLDGKIK